MISVVVLAVCSDLFLGALSPSWQQGLRGFPNHVTPTPDGISLRMDATAQDGYPHFSDIAGK